MSEKSEWRRVECGRESKNAKPVYSLRYQHLSHCTSIKTRKRSQATLAERRRLVERRWADAAKRHELRLPVVRWLGGRRPAVSRHRLRLPPFCSEPKERLRALRLEHAARRPAILAVAEAPRLCRFAQMNSRSKASAVKDLGPRLRVRRRLAETRLEEAWNLDVTPL